MSRLCTVIWEKAPRLALDVNGVLMDFRSLAEACREKLPAGTIPVGDMLALLQAWGEWEPLISVLAAEGAAEGARERYSLKGARITAPIARPPKMICTAFNNGLSERFRDRFAKTGNPGWFMKSPTCVIGPDENVELPPAGLSNVITPEVELAIVIGKRGRRVARKDAYGIVAGYTLLNDVTAQDLLEGSQEFIEPQRYFTRKIIPDPGHAWEKDQMAGPNRIEMKQWDTFAPLGPCILTKDEIPDPHSMNYFCKINGEVVMAGESIDIIWDVPEIIHRSSQIMTLEPGDVLSTGNLGRLSPQACLKPGDVMEIGIGDIGVIRNRCVASPYPPENV